MQDFPHHYKVSARTEGTANVMLSSDGLPDLETAGPPEFDGPGDVWSPETMLAGTIANCFILTFRAIARHSKFDWLSINCDVDAVLERIDKVTQFTEFHVRAELTVPAGSDQAKAQRLLEKAKNGCLITNSMKGTEYLEAVVHVAAD